MKIADALMRDPVIRGLWADFERTESALRIAKAKANPAAHKLSHDFPDGLSWRYWPAGKDGRGREIRFCWTTTRNAAGYFLGFREVRGKRGGKRDQFTASKRRTTVSDRALARRDAWRAKHAKAES